MVGQDEENEDDNPFQRYNSVLEEEDLAAQVQMRGQQNGNFRPSCPSYLQRKHERLMNSADRSNNDIDQRFILQKLLGEGAYGKVYKAIDKKTNKVSTIHTNLLHRIQCLDQPVFGILEQIFWIRQRRCIDSK